jgi:hypothetical protein
MPKGELPIAPIPSENKPKDKRIDKLRYKELPRLPVTMVQLGRVGSGKSSILYSLLTEGYVYGKSKRSVFDEMIFYVGNKESNHALEKIKCKNKCILHEFVDTDFEAYLENLKAHQLERMEKNKHPLQVAVVFDDMAGVQLLKKQKGKNYSILERLLLTSRHEAHCSVFFLSQVYKAGGFTTPLCRNNVMCWTISNMSKPEMEKIAEDHSQQYSPKEFLAMYNKAMEKPYNFITIDYRRPLNERIWERFTHPLTMEGVSVPKDTNECECETDSSSSEDSD